MIGALAISVIMTACAKSSESSSAESVQLTQSAGVSRIKTESSSAPTLPPKQDSSMFTEEEITEDIVMDESLDPGAIESPAMSPVLKNTIPQEANAKIIYTARLQMQTLDFDALMTNLNEAISNHKGYVENSGISGGNDSNGYYTNKHANLTIRIPSAEMNNFLETVGSLGNVLDSSINTENITLRYADVQARKKALEIEYERLMELLGTAKDLEAVIALEARLSEVRYQLDEFSSTLRTYDSLVDYATVHLNIDEVRKITKTNAVTVGQRISTGFSNTIYNIKVFAEDAVIFLIVNSPIIIILIVLLVIIILLSKRYNRKMRAKFSTNSHDSANSTNTSIYKKGSYPTSEKQIPPIEDNKDSEDSDKK